MAEVAGLVVGGVGLASLFAACVELFECFELGRNYAYDYQLACTKIALLRTRLTRWGAGLKVDKPGSENPLLRQQWNDEQEIIKRSLFGIKDIFENASLLAQRYDIVLAKSTGTNAGLRTLRQRTLWAIHDKKKFDRFINDLNFLIEHLETVTVRLETVQISVTQSVTQDTAEGHLPGARSSNPTRNSSKTTQQTTRSLNLDISQLAREMSGHVFVGDQYIKGGTGIMGNVGGNAQRNVYVGSQTVGGGGFAIMGNVSSDAAVFLSTRGTQQWYPAYECDDLEDIEDDLEY